MNDRCENCGQRVLNTDTTCWHCGRLLPVSEKKQTGIPASAMTETAPPLSLTVLAVYAGLTAIVFVAVIWTMQALGRQPQLLLDPDQPLLPGWKNHVSQDEAFAVQLPPGWELFEVSQDGFDQLVSASFVDALLTPFAESGHHLNTLAAAGDANRGTAVSAGFLLIAHETGIDHITAEQAIDVLQQREVGFVLLRAVLSTDTAGVTTGTLLFDLNDAEKTLRCQADVAVAPTTSYLVTICASQSQFSTQAQNLQTILQSFRPLPD